MYTCAIVEDEEIYAQQLGNLLKTTMMFQDPIIYRTGGEAIRGLEDHDVDFIFLDYKLPDITGHILYAALKPKSTIIMISASRENAAESFDLDCIVDFLVKPFELPRLLRAIKRGVAHIKEQKSTGDFLPKIEAPLFKEYIFLQTGRSTTRFKTSEILYVESYSPYLKIYTNYSCTVVNDRLINLENKLPSDQFIRVHKAYIINIDHITKMDINSIQLGDKKIQVGIKYKSTVKKILLKRKNTHNKTE